MYSQVANITAAKYKPHHKSLQLEVPYNDAIFAADYAGDNKNTSSSRAPQTFSSSVVHVNSVLGVGVMRDGQLHINPVQDVLQIRPFFSGVVTSQEIVEDISDESSSSDDDIKGGVAAGKDKKPLQQVMLRRKENERMENSRLQSYTHVKTQEEAVSLFNYGRASCITLTTTTHIPVHNHTSHLLSAHPCPCPCQCHNTT